MALYDSVFVECPHCGDDLEYRSRAGKCELKHYFLNNVPADIAMALDGQREYCEGCRNEVTIRIPAGAPKHIKMEIDMHEGNR